MSSEDLQGILSDFAEELLQKFILERRHKDGRVQFRVEKSESAWPCEQPTIKQLKEVVFKS